MMDSCHLPQSGRRAVDELIKLTELAGVPIYNGKTRSADELGAYDGIIGHKAEGDERLFYSAESFLPSATG